MRTCVGCHRTAPVDQLVRVTRAADGTLEVGRTAPGRGAWLCRGSLACLDQAVRRRAFDRALRGPVVDGATDRLRAHLGLDGAGTARDGAPGAPERATGRLRGAEALMCEDGGPGRPRGGRKREGH